MSNELVAYSRAGEAFHHRWAARRCLRLIYPNSSINEIYIEGSAETQKEGEYAIDVTEYSIDDNDKKKIDYYQLKHSTIRLNEAFRLSDLKDTITDFAARYSQHKGNNELGDLRISFTIVTNRKVAPAFKENLSAIVKREDVGAQFLKTIEGYTKLTADDLVSFCSILHLEDGEGNYNVQKEELRIELSQLIAGSIESAQINNIIALVQEKVLPDSDHIINREEVLKRFGITSEKELYPASAKWEKNENIIGRKQHNILKETIGNSSHPVIVHAAGGVGKSVFCRQLIGSLPEESFGIAYDCFGAGSYRNRSESRHKHRDALVQISNELASKGLCDPLLVQNTTLDEDIMRKFLLRVQAAVQSLKKVHATAQLFILIDAADNAEMAAKEYKQACFAHELLREKMPEGCKLVLLCRTERINLLQPQSFVVQLELQPFAQEETLENLQKWFLDANEQDGAEFHRLTSGNPRVQAIALDAKYDSLNALFVSLGPSGTTVEEQIQLQLNFAISRIKDLLPAEHHNDIKAICLGLASLPPHIPIEVLSKAANVTVEQIKSFVADIGRSLQRFDNSIQFRDEPTETWFRNEFLATKGNYQKYITALEPLALQLSYVAEVLPQLYLQAEQYDKLIEIALSDKYLPENNPIDARNIRVYRLQFAFKAALKLGNYSDAVKLAMRAGEEVAGHQRQLTLFQSNIDLLIALQSKEKVQEIAFKRLLGAGWAGSENIYSASLLSGITDYQGEARGYLRSAINWLHICFEEQKKRDRRFHHEGVQDADILELAYAELNINGVKSCTNFLLNLKPKAVVFRVVQSLTTRLIDAARFEEINDILLNFIREPYYVVAVVGELTKVGRFPECEDLEICLDLLCSQKGRIKKPNHFNDDYITSSIISFLEACLHTGLSEQKILRVLGYYVPNQASRMVGSNHSSSERTIYLKALAIHMLLSGESTVNFEAISPTEFTTKKKNADLDNEANEFREVILGLFPWYFLRARILYNENIKLLDEVVAINDASKKARNNRYRSFDILPSEIAHVCSTILILPQQASQEESIGFFQRFVKADKAFTLQDQLMTLRAVYRLPHLKSIQQEFESYIYELIKSDGGGGPDAIAESYISLARAVLNTSPHDAGVYFDEAINIVSKFGDEIVQRWEAVVSLAKRSCEKSTVSDELAYRFIRCAELVGDTVAREKHWDRSDAMCVCAKMSPGVGLSALSRWRERDVSWLEYPFIAVLRELVGSKTIPAKVGWSLTRFISHHDLNNYLSICLENEPSSVTKQMILDDAVRLLQIEGVNRSCWEDLKKIAVKYNIDSDALNSVISFYVKEKTLEATPKDKGFHDTIHDDTLEQGWEDIFDGLTISTSKGFTILLERLKSKETKDNFNWGKQRVLTEAISRLEVQFFWDFIDVVLQSDDINFYDVRHIFISLPQQWRNKASYRAKWPSIVNKIGEKYAHRFTSDYLFNSFVKDFNLTDAETEKLALGVVAGLANGNEFVGANMFFGFVSLVSNNIENQDAVSLVEYSLSQFEIHIDKDFGDGIWNAELQVAEDINKNIAGFIWAALGAPRSEVRWNAAHCIKTLAGYNCADIIDSLVWWLQDDKVGAFGHHKFPFYKLHARQYLLITFARISLDNPTILLKHSDLFVGYALNQPHAVIQKIASDIILNIEKAYPNTYDRVTLSSVSNLGKSSSSVPVAEDSNDSTEDNWQEEDESDEETSFHFGLDFEPYWFQPLGRVFDLSGKQIEDRVINVIINELGFDGETGYNNDPRVTLWNNSSNRQETWHSHGDYPKADGLDFYLTYHSMLIVAAQLIVELPVATDTWSEDNDDPWSDWLSRHLLTREDGKWLADSRDPLPLNRPSWISQEKTESWKIDITNEDFLNCLQTKENEELWVNVKGVWVERHKEHTETISISTALVCQKTSDALLRALATCSDPHDYKLPDFGEKRIEIDSGIFQLKGWIKEGSSSKRLDEFDPYADEIYYPPYSLGDGITELLGLSIDVDGKTWQTIHSLADVLICETWSSLRERRDEEPDQSGMKLKATLPFLKSLCMTLGYEIIFDVSIKRDIHYKYDRKNREYSTPRHKIFILSADGKFRTTNADN